MSVISEINNFPEISLKIWTRVYICGVATDANINFEIKANLCLLSYYKDRSLIYSVCTL